MLLRVPRSFYVVFWDVCPTNLENQLRSLNASTFFIITLIRNNGLSWLNQLIANQRRSAGRSVKSSGKKNLERGKAGAGHYLLYLSLRHILQVNGLVPKVHFPVFKPLGEQNITYTWTLFRKYAIFCIM